jgi:hypothetical protein
MARLSAGGGPADYTILTGDTITISTPSGDVDGKTAVVVGGIEVTWWNSETGGTQYTDLLNSSGAAVSSILSSDTTDGRGLGQIARVQYPEGVRGAWASANGGPRVWMPADTSDVAVAAQAQAAENAAGLAAHVSAPNPHLMASSDLTDWAEDSPAAGQVPVWDDTLGEYVPTTLGGLNPSDVVSTAGGSEIVIPTGNTTTRALGIRLPPGDRSGAANTYEVWWNAGTVSVPNWVLVTRLDAYGQLRGRPSRNDRVYGQVAALAGQTADLFQFTDAAGNPLSWVDSAGRMRAPNTGITIGPWFQETGVAGTGQYRFYNPTGTPLILRGFVVSAGGTAPAGGDFIINPKLDGVAVYSSGNRPKIVAGQRTSGIAAALTTTVWPAGSYITCDVDNVPSTAPTKVTIQGLAY